MAHALSLVVILTGCGSNDRIATYPVTGEVVFPDGTPLPGGSIIFNSQEHGELTARSPIREDGSFKLGTYATEDGAVAGQHQVAIRPPMPQQDMDEVKYRSPIDGDFLSARRSGIICQVKTDEPNHFRIEVHPPKPRRRH